LQVSEGPATGNCIPRYRLITYVVRDRHAPKQVLKTRSFREEPSLRATRIRVLHFAKTLLRKHSNVMWVREWRV